VGEEDAVGHFLVGSGSVVLQGFELAGDVRGRFEEVAFIIRRIVEAQGYDLAGFVRMLKQVTATIFRATYVGGATVLDGTQYDY
jgi:hypothetical protein